MCIFQGGRGAYKNHYKDFKPARKFPDFSIVICFMYYNRKGKLNNYNSVRASYTCVHFILIL